jgi:hypothetical protein
MIKIASHRLIYFNFDRARKSVLRCWGSTSMPLWRLVNGICMILFLSATSSGTPSATAPAISALYQAKSEVIYVKQRKDRS